VIIVKNKSDRDKVTGSLDRRVRGSGPIIVETRSNIYEYTAFMVPSQLNAKHDDAFLLLHDTCTVRPGCGAKIRKKLSSF
jgi:hypothetical protein